MVLSQVAFDGFDLFEPCSRVPVMTDTQVAIALPTGLAIPAGCSITSWQTEVGKAKPRLGDLESLRGAADDGMRRRSDQATSERDQCVSAKLSTHASGAHFGQEVVQTAGRSNAMSSLFILEFITGYRS
jgi:hypothetical protein